jgi:hypothetical protein
MERNVVAAIYEDQIERERRSNNVVITGMFPVHGVTDQAAVKQLFHQEFNVSPEIKRVQRIGTATQADKPKPIVVTLSKQKDADYLTERARQLRRSSVKAIRDNVFLNRDLTRAEQQAAFVLRQRRREAKKQSKPGVVPSSTSSQAGVSHDIGPEPMEFTLQAEVHQIPQLSRLDTTGVHPSDAVHPVDAGHRVSVSPSAGAHPVDGIISGAHPNDCFQLDDGGTGDHPIDIINAVPTVSLPTTDGADGAGTDDVSDAHPNESSITTAGAGAHPITLISTSTAATLMA